MNEVAVADRNEIMEQVLIKGDLAKLTAEQRNEYYMRTCESLGLNPLTRPFDYIVLNGKMQLYAKRDAADQLRKINGVNIEIIDKRLEGGLFMVTVRGTDKTGRQDEDMGVVTMPNGSGDIKANAMLKAITKAKRRVTLSICGLGFLDETEVEDIPAEAKRTPRQPRVVQAPFKAIESPSPGSQAGEFEQSAAGVTPNDSSQPAADELTDEQYDNGLAMAAKRGDTPQERWQSLKSAWEFLPVEVQDRLRDNLNNVHKKTARGEA